MILGDNPTGHGFVVRDLVIIELSGHAPPSSLEERWKGGALKISEKILLGGIRNFNFGGEVFGTFCGFSSKPFLKELASHVSAAMLQLKFRCTKFFLIHPRH